MVDLTSPGGRGSGGAGGGGASAGPSSARGGAGGVGEEPSQGAKPSAASGGRGRPPKSPKGRPGGGGAGGDEAALALNRIGGLPLLLPDKLPSAKLLVEVAGDSEAADMSGDVGVVGRVRGRGDPLGGREGGKPIGSGRHLNLFFSSARHLPLCFSCLFQIYASADAPSTSGSAATEAAIKLDLKVRKGGRGGGTSSFCPHFSCHSDGRYPALPPSLPPRPRPPLTAPPPSPSIRRRAQGSIYRATLVRSRVTALVVGITPAGAKVRGRGGAGSGAVGRAGRRLPACLPAWRRP